MDILSILERRGWQPKKKATSKGDIELKGECPWCGEGRDRFIVWPTRLNYMNVVAGSFWCRVCEKRGNAYNLLVDIYELDSDAAREILLHGHSSSQSQDSIAKRDPSNKKTPAIIFDSAPSDEWQFVFRRKIKHFNKLLLDNSSNEDKKEALSFLKRRGVSRMVIDRGNIGINTKTFDVEIEGHDDPITLYRGIYIPVFGINGNIIRIKIRRFESDLSKNSNLNKYISITGGHQRSIGVFHLHNAVSYDADFIWTTESELDACVMSYYGNAPVIASSSKSLFPFVLNYCTRNKEKSIFILDTEIHPLGKNDSILLHPLLKEISEKRITQSNQIIIGHFSKKDACKLIEDHGVDRLKTEMEKIKKYALSVSN